MRNLNLRQCLNFTLLTRGLQKNIKQAEKERVQKKVDLELKELKNVGPISEFDKGVQNVKEKRVEAKPPVQPEKKVAKYRIQYFIHEFRNDILVKWSGYDLKDATRESKSRIRQDLGVDIYKKGLDDLKANMKERKEQYLELKESAKTNKGMK